MLPVLRHLQTPQEGETMRNHVDLYIKGAAAVAGALSSYVFGGWSAMLGVLLALAVVDYLSGFTAAALAGKLSSDIGYRGIAKKIGLFVVVAVAAQIDKALGNGHAIRDAATFWYAANEILSVIENLGRVGVPIPPVIVKAVSILKEKGEASK
jgi:toxin secretion/phage lysis holin